MMQAPLKRQDTLRLAADLGAMVQKKGLDIDLNELVRLVKSIMEAAKQAALESDDHDWQMKVVGLAEAAGKAAVLLIRSIAKTKEEDDDRPYLQGESTKKGKKSILKCYSSARKTLMGIIHDLIALLTEGSPASMVS